MLKTVLSFALLALALPPLSAPFATERKLKSDTKKREGSKAKRPAPFSDAERILMGMGGRSFVLKLRRVGLNPEAYLKAFYSTRGAVKLYRQGSYGDAIFLFVRAFRLIKSPTIKYWMGKTYLAFGNSVKAKESFDTFLKLSPKWRLTPINPTYIKEATHQVEKLKRSLVALRVTANVKGAEISVNDQVLRVGDTSVKTPYHDVIWLKPGFTSVVFTKKGYVNKEIQIKHAKKGQSLTRHVTLLTPREMIKKSRLFLAAQRARKEQEQKRKLLWKRYQKQQKEMAYKAKIRKRSVRYFGYVTIGVGVAVLGVGGGIAWSAQNRSHDVEAKAKKRDVSWREIKPDYEKFQNQRTKALFLTGIGGTILLGGLIIIYIGNLEPSTKMKTPFDYFLGNPLFRKKVSVQPIMGPNSMGLNLNVAF